MSDDIRSIVNDVILNFKAQAEWLTSVDPAFLVSLEVFAKVEIETLSKAAAFRLGVIIGALYEKWKEGAPMLNITDIVIPQYKEQGFTLEEEGDHILILRHHGKEIGRFSVPGVRIAEIVATIEGQAIKKAYDGKEVSK